MDYPETINGLGMCQFDQDPDRIVFHVKRSNHWLPITLREVHTTVERIGLALRSQGVGSGTKVAIISQTRPEWVMADSAILGLGGITVGIYPTSTADQIAYILDHSESEIAIIEDKNQFDKLEPCLFQLSRLRLCVLIADADLLQNSAVPIQSWHALVHLGGPLLEADPHAFRRSSLAVQPNDIATLIYTSGTTGQPKGAILTHGNFYRVVKGISSVFDFRPNEVGVIYLPLAHALQRFACYQGTEFRGIGYFAESIEKLPENLLEIRPTMFAAVPRVLEKIYTRVLSTIDDGPPIRRRLFNWAIGIGTEFHKRAGKVSLITRWQYHLADRLVLSRIRSRLGGRVDRIVSGGAPLSPAISEFFFGLGILVIEGYGLTETSAVASINTPSQFKFGTVGKPVPGVEIRINDDGEVLIRGPGLFQGYYRNPEATAASLRDGWFFSGDIGTVDSDGFLTITDRKKDLIITSGGKNIAPQPIENRLKQHRLISNAMLHGDKRNFISALITVDLDEVRLLLKNPSLSATDACRTAEIKQAIHSAVEEVNRTLAPYESVKKHAILDIDFSVDSGELTPTLKLKRRVVEERHRSILDQFYQ